MPDQPGAAPDILFREEGRAGFMTLNRQHALNALTHEMVRGLEAHHLKWASTPKIYGVILEAAPGRAFCGGGDIRAIAEGVKADHELLLDFFRDEYQHNWTLSCFTKPNVSLIDGIVMGGGVGISLYGTHRVAGEGLRFAMPETGIGFCPDIGASYFLPRFPGEIGMYMALTGHVIGPADAYYAGVATHCIPQNDFSVIRNAMVEGDPIDQVLDRLHQQPGVSALAELQPVIDKIFSAGSVPEILARLDKQAGHHGEWAQETAAIIRRRSPLSLKVAYRQMREGRMLSSLKEALQMEFRLVTRFLASHDFPEGVRAALIDKDRNPKWRPESLDEVNEAEIAAFFAPLEKKELELIDRWTLIE